MATNERDHASELAAPGVWRKSMWASWGAGLVLSAALLASGCAEGTTAARCGGAAVSDPDAGQTPTGGGIIQGRDLDCVDLQIHKRVSRAGDDGQFEPVGPGSDIDEVFTFELRERAADGSVVYRVTSDDVNARVERQDWWVKELSIDGYELVGVRLAASEEQCASLAESELAPLDQGAVHLSATDFDAHGDIVHLCVYNRATGTNGNGDGARLTIQKATDGDLTQPFAFTILDADGAPIPPEFTLVHGETESRSLSGRLYVAEAKVTVHDASTKHGPEWELERVDCTSDRGQALEPGVVDEADRWLVEVTVAEDEHLTCVFHNRVSTGDGGDGEWCSPGFFRNHPAEAALAAAAGGFTMDDAYSSFFSTPPPRSPSGVRDEAPVDPSLSVALEHPEWYGGETLEAIADLLSDAHPAVDFTGTRPDGRCPLE
jgi:hypothetical protein